MTVPHSIRLPRPTIRLRLTLVYGALFLLSGAALLGVTYLLVSSATGNPLVYRDPNGRLAVTFAQGGAAGPGGADAPPGGAPDDVVSGTTGVPPGSEVSPDELQALAERQHAAELNQFLTWSAVALAIMAVTSVGIGWIVAGRVLRPVRTMTADVRQISTRNLHERVGLDGPDDELKDLGRTFNDLLGRLENAFHAQRQFVANASHEIRTPLARQRTLIQVALADPDASVDSFRATLDRVLAAGEQQEELIEALFTLARGERGLDHREPVDLAAVADNVIELRRDEVERHSLNLVTRLQTATTSGDPRLLERLVTNLVDNAVRYNQPGGMIEVSTMSQEARAVLRVVNDGPVVPAGEVDRLFEPFRRLGADRVGQGAGWGLGLSIVRAVAHAHGGGVTARSRPEGGLALEVRLPTQALRSADRTRELAGVAPLATDATGLGTK